MCSRGPSARCFKKFILVNVDMLLYLLAGAFIMRQLEGDHGNNSSTGSVNNTQWDFAGSFNFVCTLISTIGYGQRTPQTTAGKAFCIIYGYIGCSAERLFSKLYSEMILASLTSTLHGLHALLSRKLEHLTSWRPNIYLMASCLFLISFVFTSLSALVYSTFETWSYLNALYFCFISFTKIGFGDFVSLEQLSYPHIDWYRVVNFMLLIFGCCLMNSLLDIMSTLIERSVDYVIYKFQGHDGSEVENLTQTMCVSYGNTPGNTPQKKWKGMIEETSDSSD